MWMSLLIPNFSRGVGLFLYETRAMKERGGAGRWDELGVSARYWPMAGARGAWPAIMEQEEEDEEDSDCEARGGSLQEAGDARRRGRAVPSADLRSWCGSTSSSTGR